MGGAGRDLSRPDFALLAPPVRRRAQIRRVLFFNAIKDRQYSHAHTSKDAYVRVCSLIPTRDLPKTVVLPLSDTVGEGGGGAKNGTEYPGELVRVCACAYW